VPTFRGKDGLWKKYDPMELATPEAFRKDPELVWEWYDWRRQLIAKAEPNEGHRILVRMEEEFPNFWLITQNVDGLHQRAGSKKVVELHGNGGLLRPGVVWFGEPLPMDALQRAYELSDEADVFLVIGTSAQVYPAAELPFVAKRSGAKLVEVNPEETPITPHADISLRESASTGLKKVLELL